MNILKRSISTAAALIMIAALAGGCTKAQRSNRALKTADRYFAAEQYDLAQTYYDKAFRMVNPPNMIAARQLGLIYSLEGKTAMATVWLRHAATNEPGNLAVQIALGQAWEADGLLANARDCANQALKLDPGNEQALLVLSALATNAASVAQMRLYIQKLQQQDPQDHDRASYHLVFSMLDGKAGELDGADAEIKKSLAKDPKSSFAWAAAANLSTARGDYKGAEENFKKAAQLAPPRSFVQIEYVRFLIQRGSNDIAGQVLLDLHKQAPDYLPTLIGMMDLSFMEKKFDECNTNIARVLGRDPQNYEALMKKGSVSLARGNGKQAVADFERMALLTAKYPTGQVHYELALAYLLDNNRPQALTAINHALEYETNFVAAKLLKADLVMRGGNPDDAIAMLSEMEAKSQPGQVLYQIKHVLAKAYLAKNQPAQAVAEYESLEKLQPKDPQIPYLMGLAWLQAKNIEKARAAFQKSFELDPNYASPFEELVNLDLVQKRFADAQSLVNNEIVKATNSALPWVLQAKIELAQTNTAEAVTSLQTAVKLEPKQPLPYLLLARIDLDAHQIKPALEKLNDLVAITNDATAYLQIGMIYDQLTNYDLATKSYEKVLEGNSNSAIALNNLAFDYSERLNQPGKAYELAKRLINFDAGDRMGFGSDTLGWILYKRGEFQHALDFLKESAGKQNEPSVYYHLGMAYYMMGQQDPARQALGSALAKDDFEGKEDATRSMAILSLDPQKASPADRATLEKQIQDRPGDAIALMKLAYIEDRGGDYKNAAEHYGAAIKQNPDNVAAMIPLARIYALPLKQPQKGLEMAKSAHKAAPDNPNASALLGKLVFQAPDAHDRDFTFALELLQDAANKTTGQPELLHDLAWAYFSVGNTNQAQAAMNSAIGAADATFPQLDDARQFQAMLAAGSSADQPGTADQVKKVLSTAPDYGPALLASALIQEHQGQNASAEQLYEKILAAYPPFSPARRALALLHTHDGNDTKAYDELAKARELYPADPDLARASGVVAFRRKDYQKSSEWLAPIAPNYPNDPELDYDLGVDYAQLKQVPKARTNLNYALQLKTLPVNLATNAQHILSGLK